MNWKKEIVDNDQILNIVDEREKLFNKDDNNRTIEILKKDYLIEIEKLEELLLNSIEENDLKLLKTEFPDKLEIFN